MKKMTHTCTMNTRIGEIRLSAVENELTGLWFTGQKHYPKQIALWENNPNLPVFATLREWLAKYFEGEYFKQKIKLRPAGTDFQKSVWNSLLEIPVGQIVTYGEIANRINCKSARAVGGAVGRNPISILIPCHRVVGANGNITGYAGGIDKKRALLGVEGGMCADL